MNYWLSGCLSFCSIKQHNTLLQVFPLDFLRKSCCRYMQVLLLTMLTGQLSQRQGVDTRKLTLFKSRLSRTKGTLVAHSEDAFWFWRWENEDHYSWTILITDSFAHGCSNQLCLQNTGIAAPSPSYWLLDSVFSQSPSQLGQLFRSPCIHSNNLRGRFTWNCLLTGTSVTQSCELTTWEVGS